MRVEHVLDEVIVNPVYKLNKIQTSKVKEIIRENRTKKGGFLTEVKNYLKTTKLPISRVEQKTDLNRFELAGVTVYMPECVQEVVIHFEKTPEKATHCKRKPIRSQERYDKGWGIFN